MNNYKKIIEIWFWGYWFCDWNKLGRFGSKYIVEFFSVFLFLDYILVLFDGCGVIFLLWFMFGF